MAHAVVSASNDVDPVDYIGYYCEGEENSGTRHQCSVQAVVILAYGSIQY